LAQFFIEIQSRTRIIANHAITGENNREEIRLIIDIPLKAGKAIT
jgi:hypothetical protein